MMVCVLVIVCVCTTVCVYDGVCVWWSVYDGVCMMVCVLVIVCVCVCVCDGVCAAEANVHNDPDAAKLVFSHITDVVMAGLNVTKHVELSDAFR